VQVCERPSKRCPASARGGRGESARCVRAGQALSAVAHKAGDLVDRASRRVQTVEHTIQVSRPARHWARLVALVGGASRRVQTVEHAVQ
jgi:hypothetical protein